jgi:DNA-binding transcriptional regulator GbsR (MarR family)
MTNDEMTTIQISKAASLMLEALAETYKRSKKSHAEWLIEQDYRKLEDVKPVGAKANKVLKSKTNQAAIQA